MLVGWRGNPVSCYTTIGGGVVELHSKLSH